MLQYSVSSSEILVMNFLSRTILKPKIWFSILISNKRMFEIHSTRGKAELNEVNWQIFYL